jgi:hypothetical protein
VGFFFDATGSHVTRSILRLSFSNCPIILAFGNLLKVRVELVVDDAVVLIEGDRLLASSSTNV